MNDKQLLLKSMYPNYTAWYAPWWTSSYLVWVISFVAFAALVYIGYIVYVRFFKKKKSEYQLISEFLLSIIHRPMHTPHDIKKGYHDLVVILKRFVYMAYSYDMGHETEEQMIASLELLDSDLYKKCVVSIQRALYNKYAPDELVIEQAVQQLQEDAQLLLMYVQHHHMQLQKK